MRKTETKIELTIQSRWNAVEMEATVTQRELDGRGNRVQPERRRALPKIDLLSEPKRARKIAKALGIESEVRTMFAQHTVEARRRAEEEAAREQSEAESNAKRRVSAQQRADQLDAALAVWT